MPITYFISGSNNITESEFQTHYVPSIDKAYFVVGDSKGTDTMSQNYLKDKTKHITVYHMKDEPRNNTGGYYTIGHFHNKDIKDIAMTAISQKDIAWLKPEEEDKHKRKKRTQKNLSRRLKQVQEKIN
jgi:hypothetical protein